MVRGIDKFKEFFAGFEDNYVIIGGTACDVHEENYALVPRATKDIDIILIVEALTSEFVSRFWEFIKIARYGQNSQGIVQNKEHRHEYYRFKEPASAEFPYQIELFSRSVGLIDLPEDAHITPIPVDDDLSSLSAILMSDDYYYFTIAHSRLEDGIHIANIESLICLKCKAYLELSSRKEIGEPIDRKHIAKHMKDVFRLAAMLAPADRFDLPVTLRDDVSGFCASVNGDLPNQDFFKAAGLRNVTGEQVLEQIKETFSI